MFSATVSTLIVLGGFAWSAAAEEYTVWASVVFARSGEHAPTASLAYADQLTPEGANQLFDLGSALRDRYLSTSPIPGLATDYTNPSQIYVLASGDTQFAPASAQALMQGLYPPVQNPITEQQDPLGSTPNGTKRSPLGNYQYPFIQAPSMSDEDMIYVNGALSCPAFDTYYDVYSGAAQESATESTTQSLYTAVGKALGDAQFSETSYGYWNADEVYEYVSFLYNHNKTAFDALTTGKLAGLKAYDRLRYLSDQYQWNLYGNVSDSKQTISRVGGQTLATKIVELLSLSIGESGQNNKLNVLVGDYGPLLSFFSLSDLDIVDSAFTGTPLFGSAAIFELIAPREAGQSFPDPSAAIVRFLFRNGTGTEATFKEWRIFPKDRERELPLSWDHFVAIMNGISMSNVDWCEACNAWADTSFCLFYNTTAVSAAFGLTDEHIIAHLDPAAAGFIGACIMFAALAALLTALVTCCGLRLSFTKRNSKQGAGGFKGSQKMASDADLTVAKGGGGTKDDEQDAKERVGSWELKNQAAANKALGIDSSLQPPMETSDRASRPLSFASSLRGSFDTHDPNHNPFQDPVKPREHV